MSKSRWFEIVLTVAALSWTALFSYHQGKQDADRWYAKHPRIEYRSASPISSTHIPEIPLGWSVSCVALNGANKTITPLYSVAECWPKEKP